MDAIEVWMVSEVLSLRAEAQVSGFRQLEGLMNAQVHIDQSRPVEDISPQCAKAQEGCGPTWVRGIGEKCIWSSACERGIAGGDIIRNGSGGGQPRFTTSDPMVVCKDAIGRAATAVDRVQV